MQKYKVLHENYGRYYLIIIIVMITYPYLDIFSCD